MLKLLSTSIFFDGPLLIKGNVTLHKIYLKKSRFGHPDPAKPPKAIVLVE